MIEISASGLLSFDEISAFTDSISKPSPRCIRLRLDRQGLDTLPLEVVPVPWFSRGRLLVDSKVRPSQLLQYAAADYYIQDAGSLLALAVLDAQPHESVCDLCAAPGGKSSGICEVLREGGFLVSNELIGSRVPILRYAMSRTGNPRYAVTQQDPDQIGHRFAGQFDAVLVDAPCSGQAMVGSGKRTDNAFDSKQVEHSARRQQRILLSACKLLKPGGRLIYSTCTFAVEENEAQIRFLHSTFPDAWEPLRIPALERWASPLEAGCYRTWPHRDPTAGAFAAGLRLKKSIAVEIESKPLSVRHKQGHDQSLDRRRLVRSNPSESLEAFGESQRLLLHTADNGDIYGIAVDAPTELVNRIDKREFPKLATQKSELYKPEYSLAMLNSDWFEPARPLELDDADARKYMCGEAIFSGNGSKPSLFVGSSSKKTGKPTPWVCVRWHQKSLGWGKFADNRVNNHLPNLAILPMGIQNNSSPTQMISG